MASPLDNPAFLRWFGQSKVVDESGEPLVVYHGTPDQYKFDVFKTVTGKHSVFWFASDLDTASTYARSYMRAPRKDDPVLRPDLSERFMERTPSTAIRRFRSCCPSGRRCSCRWAVLACG